MKHIIITKEIRDLAVEFRTQLKTKRGNYIPPIEKLAALKSRLTKSIHKQYVQLIIDKWDDLIIAKPEDFSSLENSFCAIIATNDISKEETQKDILLYPQIIDAMRYDNVQSTIYPNYITKLGIKTCVYCNAQYAFAVTGRKGYINYELDHYMPKSKYPYLCTTFMNLQPCCPKCNKKKSNKEPDPNTEEIFELFKPEGEPVVPRLFNLDNASIATYMASAKSKDLKILFDYPGNPKLKNGYENFFQISTLYQAHKDVAEELIWKQKIYNHIIRDIYKEQFKVLGFKDIHFNRFILGNYDKADDIHKRPLSKMVQDVAQQLKIL